MKQTKQLPKIFLFLATSFLLGSCQLGKHYTRPQLQLPETLDSTSVDSTSLGDYPWEQLYTDTTLADLFTYGIEGTDYDLVDGRISPKGDLYSHSPWESTSVEATSLIIDEPENKVQLYKDFNEKSNSSCASGFRFNQSSVEAQIAACNNVYNEYGYVLEQGGYNESDVDQTLVDYQNALDEAGYQDILSEIQSQYEAWKATK